MPLTRYGLRECPLWTIGSGVPDDLRAALRVGSTCWAVAVLLRATADGPFPDHEVDQVRALTPYIARAIKNAVCRLDAEALGSAAMLVVDGANRIDQLTIEAGRAPR